MISLSDLGLMQEYCQCDVISLNYLVYYIPDDMLRCYVLDSWFISVQMSPEPSFVPFYTDNAHQFGLFSNLLLLVKCNRTLV